MIQSVERAFSLLYEIAESGDHVSISQLARDVDLPRTTVVRLLETLQEVGAVKSAETRDDYELGDKLLSLLSNTSYNRQIVAIAQPVLQKLAAQTGETIYFCLPDGDWCYFASQINARYKIRIEDATGERHPLHITSPGKLFLAHRSAEEQAIYLSRNLEKYSEQSVVSAEGLRRQFTRIINTGISWNHNEYEIGYASVAAAIFNQHGDIVAAPAIGAPIFRIHGNEHEKELEHLVCEAAQQITQRLR